MLKPGCRTWDLLSRSPALERLPRKQGSRNPSLPLGSMASSIAFPATPLYHATTLPITSTSSHSVPTIPPPRRVAVVGAGAAGLVAARELQRQGLSVVVFEQNDRLGGVWSYSPEVEDDPLGLRPDRRPVHSSMYESLRTNLPREIMGYLDFPFLVKEGRDGRRYPGHEEVLLYLQDFSAHYHLLPCIRFGRRVKHVGIREVFLKNGASIVMNGSGPEFIKSVLERISREVSRSDELSPENSAECLECAMEIQWCVTSEAEVKTSDMHSAEEEVFDAVVVSNGHYFQPKIAMISGVEKWPGKQLHSHNYRVPSDFTDQVVVVIGNSASGNDISIEIATVAREVHWSGRKWNPSVDISSPIGPSKNIRLHLQVESAHEDGSVKFEDGGSVVADIILHCTGYAFSFPFLDTAGIVRVDNDCVGPLYKHVFPPLLAPSLSFIGLPFKVVPFPLMELQAKWIALCLSCKVQLPSRKGMIENIEDFYATIKAEGRSKNDTHKLENDQFDYNDWLASQCGCTPPEDWRKEIYLVSSKRKHTDDDYRNTWTDQILHETAMEDLKKIGRSIQYI